MLRRLAVIAVTFGVAAATFAFLFPIANRFTRLLAILGLAAVVLGLTTLSWSRRGLRWTVLLLLGAGTLFILWPGSFPPRNSDLQKSYLSQLKNLNDVTYVWGGENCLGIDCSGLIRRGMIDALATTGIRTLNPHGVRLAIRLWWNDTTARGLGNSADTLPISSTPGPLPDLSVLQPGDLAVSGDETHILAYLGDDHWIDADPSAQKVRILPTAENPWLAEPVRIVRWKWLD